MNLCGVLEKLNQRHIPAEKMIKFVEDCFFDSEEQDLFIQFLRMQRNQIFNLQEHFDRYWNLLPIFGFSSAIYVINLIKSYLLSIFFSNKRDINRQL